MDKSLTSASAANAAASTTLSRRTVFVGAGAVGAVGAIGALAAAASLPGAAPALTKVAQAQLDPAGGYQLTEHVKQYYATARI